MRLCPLLRSRPRWKGPEVFLETNIPAAQPPTPKDARFSRSDEVGRRPKGYRTASRKGAPPPDRIARPVRDGRLRSAKDFRFLYDHGTAVRGSLMILVYCRNERSGARTAFVASGRVGKAVARNRCKRLLREAYRTTRDSVELDGWDVVFVARKQCQGASVFQVIGEVEDLYKKAGLWAQPAMRPDGSTAP